MRGTTTGQRVGKVIGRVLGDAIRIALIIVVWEAFGAIGVLAYFTLGLVVGLALLAAVKS